MSVTVPRQSEQRFQEQVTALAHLLGWRCASFRPARTERGWRTPVGADGAGWPDMCLAHPQHGFLVRELKTGTGLSQAQSAWLDLLTKAGVNAGVWKPSDWVRIEAELRGAA